MRRILQSAQMPSGHLKSAPNHVMCNHPTMSSDRLDTQRVRRFYPPAATTLEERLRFYASPEGTGR